MANRLAAGSKACLGKGRLGKAHPHSPGSKTVEAQPHHQHDGGHSEREFSTHRTTAVIIAHRAPAGASQ